MDDPTSDPTNDPLNLIVAVPVIPSITIYVRHSSDCKSRVEGEKYRKCKCRKWLRWSQGGRQYRQPARTRSWEQAETNRRTLESKFASAEGKPIADVRIQGEGRKTITKAIELFLKSKRNKGVDVEVVKKYERELGRLEKFMASRSKFLPAEIKAEDLTEYQAGWSELYESTLTRWQVLGRLRTFLRYCYNREWISRIPETDPVKIDRTPTLPFTPEQYQEILAAIPKAFPTEKFSPEKAKKVRALVQLMRYSGLAIRDAVTLERSEIVHNPKKKLYKVLTARTKTDTDVYVPIPEEVAREILDVANDNPRYLFWNTGTGTADSAVTNWLKDLKKMFTAAGFPRPVGVDKETGEPIICKGTSHQIRDTFACELLQRGVPIEEVSRALGHTSIKVTEAHYSAWVQARQDRLDSLIVGTWDDK